MLTEDRYAQVIEYVNQRGSITVEELSQLLKVSLSTIRRDLNFLDQKGKLKKLHGGATSIYQNTSLFDEKVEHRILQHSKDKERIAIFASKLIQKNDFIYLDAGTSTSHLIPFLPNAQSLTFVTNAILHAKELAERKHKVYLLGGFYKGETEAIVGNKAVESLQNYHFRIGFFGTNGIDLTAGFTTPEVEEASVKKEALARCTTPYILADTSKFSKISAITFAALNQATIITNAPIPSHYNDQPNILEVKNS